MLELRPGCERCDKDLPAHQPVAVICSFECTFCLDCAEKMNHLCPNCEGELLPRPTRSLTLLEQYPANKNRVFKG